MRPVIMALAVFLVGGVLAPPAIATDRARELFVDQVRGAAAWRGVLLQRIQWGGGVVLAHGIDQQGRVVTLRESCRQGRIDCPKLEIAQSGAVSNNP